MARRGKPYNPAPVKRHHPWCNYVAAPPAGCRQCERLFRDYPFLPGEDHYAAAARYFPQAQPITVTHPEPELVVIRPGRVIEHEPKPVVEWIDTLEQPKSLTMRDFPWQVPLYRVDDDTLVERRASEVQRLAAVRNPTMKKKRIYDPKQLGEPNRDRYVKGEGFEMENLAPPGAPPVIRGVAKSPLTPPEAEKRVTPLDRALQDNEVQALYRFVVGTMVGDGKMRLSAKDDRRPELLKPDGSNSTSRLPFTNSERLEIGARQHVYAKLPPESQRDMDIFTDQVMPRNNRRSNEFYISPTHFGSITAGSTCERKAMGAYIGTFKKLAHHIYHLYLEWEMIQFRMRQEATAAKKSRIAQDAEKSFVSAKKVLA
jgi:hypothetical protein